MRRFLLGLLLLMVGNAHHSSGQVLWNHAVAGDQYIRDLLYMEVDSSTYMLTGYYAGNYVWNEGSSFPSISMTSVIEEQEYYNSGFVAFMNNEGEVYDLWQFDPVNPTLNEVWIRPIQVTDSDVAHLMFGSVSNTNIDLDPDTLSTVSQTVSLAGFVIGTYDMATGDLLQVTGTAGGWYGPRIVCDSETGFLLNYESQFGETLDITFMEPEVTITGDQNFSVLAKYNDNFELQWHQVLGQELNVTIQSNFLYELNDGRIVWHVIELDGGPGATIDLDPSAAVDLLESGGSALIIYDANGNYQGSFKNVEWIESMEQLGENDIRFFGSVTGTADLDPSQNELLFNSYTNNADVVEVSVDGDFNVNWYKSMRGTSSVTAGIAEMGSPTSTIQVNASEGSFDGDLSDNGFRLFENQSANLSLVERVDDSGSPLAVVELNGAQVVIPNNGSNRCLIVQDHNQSPHPVTVNGVTYGLNTQISDEGWQFIMLNLGEYSSVHGQVFSDDNGNGLWDAGEGPFYQRTSISCQELNGYVSVDTNGSYLFTVNPDEYSFDVHLPLYRSVSSGQTFPFQVNAAASTTFEMPAIGVYTEPNIIDFDVNFGLESLLQIGFTGNVSLTVGNVGSVTTGSGELVLKLPPMVDVNDITPSPVSANADSIVWDYSGLDPLQSSEFRVQLTTENNSSLIGDTALFSGYITTSGTDVNEANNSFNLHTVVVGSYDPNDKRVFPNVVDSESDHANAVEPLSYIIRFQNTGNFPTSFVHIIDTIPEELDLSTFRMINSSHPCQVHIGQNRDVTWSFDPLVLPDSTSDPEGSIGYLHFTIALDLQNQNADGITENRAFIYFDFNPPIITEWSVFEISDWISVEEFVASGNGKVLVYPNPSTGLFNLTYQFEVGTQPTLQLRDMLGRLVQTVQLPSNEGTYKLDANGLDTGVYFCTLHNVTEVLATQKLSVVKKE